MADTREGGNFDYIIVGAGKLRPESRGDLAITSPDIHAPPRIRVNYLSHPADQATAVALVRSIRNIVAHPPLANRVLEELDPTAGCRSDEEILGMFRRYGHTACHACGTCSMGSGPDAVVDARTRVHGLDGLRVVDASIYPVMLSGNLNAPTMAVAMRAADLILQDRH